MKNLLDLEHKLNYYFNDRNLLKNALLHKSLGNERKEYKNQTNERLELLGDAVLDLIVAEYLYKSYKNASEGPIAKLKAMIVSEPILAKISRQIGVGKFLMLSRGEVMSGGRNRESILADSFEAILGAVYIDSNLDEARVFALSHIKQYIDHIEENEDILDFKSILQEYVQKEFKTVPTYELVAERGPDHMKEFEIQVIVGNYKEKAVARNKKKAEQLSAKALCIKLGVKYNEAL
ncbi:Ribonuclease III [Fusobacterium nucleatum subsp. nucleatum ATCC 25586]|uniref:Ribonuclease 3 n=1 Tax=Fusobacterium nucleatum subsp. nucleatum (strain ATCC 25586 / DSM 15643 / BCRC 10681 / CIP 101130 / JCM 8532 / KCTC 2640 / LMG 13131 / VPI 4355) TaxID=190304 RepID=RNC_FUSNN|nr:RecName: Full=Ribonuclease 3; AltName: Full=Ribonuclease III; Short=RNase III [Fusobacterium nucleatum subsp. nucleatum ATCC 25586]AAL94358.1 Ribonuclease III [Fusobacterium nucleatum subsp. nucleatum ATCC 25586]